MQSDSANNTARVAVRGRHYRCDIIRSLAIRTKVEATRKKKMETRQGVKERKKKMLYGIPRRNVAEKSEN